MKPFHYSAFLCPKEGQENLRDTVRIAVEACAEKHISQLIIFTNTGKGLEVALELLGDRKDIKLTGVQFPTSFVPPRGKETGIPNELVKSLEGCGARILRASEYPFNVLSKNQKTPAPLTQAFRVFGGGMSLVMQAVLMACDAGVIAEGEHVIAAAADTVIVAMATKTENFLTKFIVREVVCKPLVLDITRKEKPPESSQPQQPENH